MRYRLAADLVLLFHFLFAAFAVFGGFLALCDPRWPFCTSRPFSGPPSSISWAGPAR